MGPFPHDAPPPAIDDHNPMGTDGFAFVEYAHPEPEKLHALFRQMGFAPVARHRDRAVTLYRQGDVNYLLNEEPGSQATRFAAAHGPSVPSMGFRVVDAQHAYRRALALGAAPADPAEGGLALDIPAIRGIGGSLLYFVDRYGAAGSVYDDCGFEWLGEREPAPRGAGLFYIDHLTHNVHRGRMDVWYEFYARLFNFRQIRYFDIKGEYTGLFSRALTSPDGRIRIPLNESADEESQIEEYLRAYKGEGIQHIACGCSDIYGTIEGLRAAGLAFMPAPPDTYYERVDARLPGHGEDIARLKRNGILVDGEGVVEHRKARLLLQIFSGNVIGPVFFEFIERKGDDGFGEGNFRALFESIEEDQIRRGVIGAAREPAAAK
ncbi:4-hydroxyphenylpyruvate dioxygenase [Teichococcus aestuarii]|uniref:4-hydroxyphenylpyruvate dioxygenase n=1 Tax=Teichococcus aestuarii TaxID=568898 RepID=A0A2U1V0Y3_9PROT|nr:4-hydroxyphenylpyruvate dioxygenase [Pseudoroseomonas aestuarii]PWC27560.1 4-hydroxyphenylpyruvate dioxygenase [Pseudoroseomonas aestuarii]